MAEQFEGQAPEGGENGNNGGNGTTGGLEQMLIPMVVIFAIMYLVMIRPQKKKERAKRELLNTVKSNDEIVTVGGIHGIVTTVKEHEVIVRVDDKTKLRFNRSAIARIIRDDKDITE